MSERRACEAIGQPRSTQRYEPKEAEDEKPLVRRMKQLSAEHPRYGYRRVWALLRRERFAVNRKRVHRLWRREGLKVPRKQRKRRRLGHGKNSCTRRKAEHVNHVWSYDFVMDQTSDGKRLKLMPVVVLTSSHEEKDMMRSYKLGVNAYVLKPVDFHEFVNAIKELGVFWAVINEPPPGSVKKAP